MAIYEGVKRVNDELEVVSGLISSKREFLLKQAVNSVLLFIILIVFGCLDFATLDFHGEYLLTASYWGTIVTKMIAAICAFNVGINMMLDNEIKKNEELQENIRVYNILNAQRDTDFEYFVNKIFNVDLKKRAYLSKINQQIYRLNKFSRRRDRLLYSSDLPENQAKKKKNLYCIKRAELEELKSDEYINKNLDNLVVRYRDVDAAVFELEINGAQKSNGVVVSGNLAVGRAKESSSIIMSMLAISMLTTSFALSASKEVFEDKVVAFWHYCLKAMEDVGVVLWQFLNGILRSRKIVSSQLTKPYAGRILVLNAYINWRNETKAANSPAYELTHEKILEVTEDQYNAMQQTQQ